MKLYSCFRPLARWIGCFTLGLEKNIDVSIYAFPSPSEVGRFLYCSQYKHYVSGEFFPSPLEVDRFLYACDEISMYQEVSFRPLSRWIGSYTEADDLIAEAVRVSVPSRGR